MADTDTNPIEKMLPYFFWGNNPNVNAQLRQRIALQMMSQKKGYPKNIGEGLTAIGDSLGDIGMAKRLEAADLAQQGAAKQGPPGGGALAYAPPTDVKDEAPAAAAAPAEPTTRSIVPPDDVQPATDTLVNTPQQPASMLSPQPMTSGQFAPPPQQPPPNVAALPADQGGYNEIDAQANTPPPQQATAPPPQPPPQQDPRARIATALSAQAVPRPNPTLAGAASPPIVARTDSPEPGGPTNGAVGGTIPNVLSGARKAPPPQVLPQVAQAQIPQSPVIPGPGYVMPRPEPPKQPNAYQDMSPTEARYTAWKLANPNNAYIQQQADAVIAVEQQRRAAKQALILKDYEDEKTRFRENEKLYQGQLGGAAKARQDYEKESVALQEAKDNQVLSNRLGGRDKGQFFTEFDKEKESAIKASNAIHYNSIARKAIEDGVITGSGATWKINTAKLVDLITRGKYGGDVATNTEVLQAALKSTLGQAVENVQGSGGRVSDTDVKVASGTIGADPNMQLAAIKRIIAENDRQANLKLNTYEDKKDYYLGGTRAEKMYEIPTRSTGTPAHLETLLKHKDRDDVIKEYNDRFGQGAAELEIARAKRRERRGG